LCAPAISSKFHRQPFWIKARKKAGRRRRRRRNKVLSISAYPESILSFMARFSHG